MFEADSADLPCFFAYPNRLNENFLIVLISDPMMGVDKSVSRTRKQLEKIVKIGHFWPDLSKKGPKTPKVGVHGFLGLGSPIKKVWRANLPRFLSKKVQKFDNFGSELSIFR